jgi:hypothetical protein
MDARVRQPHYVTCKRAARVVIAMILLWGLPADTPLTWVRSALARRGAEVAFIDQHDVLQTEVDLVLDGSGQGAVTVLGRSVRLCEVTAAYIRPHSSTRLPVVEHAGRHSREWRHAAAVDDVLTAWADLAPALVVNRPGAMASNGCKPFQARFIEAAGFEVPATLVTTDPEAVHEFRLEHGEVIYKSLSAVRSIVSKLDERHTRRFEHVRWCPTQFQQYIDGTDCRVHVIGEHVFACEIHSDAVDYRYASRQGLGVEHTPVELPQDVAERCIALTLALGLHMSGIDLRRDREGRWHCFEVNPSPAFSYYQSATGQPLDEAVADLLLKATDHTNGEEHHGACGRILEYQH